MGQAACAEQDLRSLMPGGLRALRSPSHTPVLRIQGLGWGPPAPHLHHHAWHGQWPLGLSEEHLSSPLKLGGGPGESPELQQAPGTACPAWPWHPQPGR